jgi:hypothetical protein
MSWPELPGDLLAWVAAWSALWCWCAWRTSRAEWRVRAETRKRKDLVRAHGRLACRVRRLEEFQDRPPLITPERYRDQDHDDDHEHN